MHVAQPLKSRHMRASQLCGPGSKSPHVWKGFQMRLMGHSCGVPWCESGTRYAGLTVPAPPNQPPGAITWKGSAAVQTDMGHCKADPALCSAPVSTLPSTPCKPSLPVGCPFGIRLGGLHGGASLAQTCLFSTFQTCLQDTSLLWESALAAEAGRVHG